VLSEILGLYNKPKAVVHSVQKLTGPKKKKKKKELARFIVMVNYYHKLISRFAYVAAPLNVLRKNG
jgi:hypothetical protein